jgi:hypothetical protein
MSRRVNVGSEVKSSVNSTGRSRSESESEKGAKFPALDPKPGELPMGRVKSA